MTISDAATLKGYFQTGDKPTQAQFTDLIDTAVRDVLVAIATAAEGGGVGFVEIKGTTEVSVHASADVGYEILTADSTASVASLLAGTFGQAFLQANSTASARSLLAVVAASAVTTLNGLTDVSAPTPTSGASLQYLGGEWVAATAAVASAAAVMGASQAGRNGYITYPNGFIRQWGVASGVGGTSTRTIAYPVTFSSLAGYSITCVKQVSAAVNNDAYVQAVSAAGARFYNSTSSTINIYWNAVGK